MANPRRDPKTLRVTTFGKALAEELGATLATTKPVVQVGEADLIGALLYAARRSPLESIKANVGAYRDYQLDYGDELAAVEAVGQFIANFGRS